MNYKTCIKNIICLSFLLYTIRYTIKYTLNSEYSNTVYNKYKLILMSQMGNKESIYELALFYKGKSEYENMEKYYIIASDNGHDEASYNLAVYYESIGKYNKMGYYYLRAISQNNTDAMISYANFLYKLRKYEDALHYYLCIDSDDYKKKIGYCYFYLNKINAETEKYVRFALEDKENKENKEERPKTTELAYVLSKYYYKTKEYHNVIKCNIILFKNGIGNGIIEILKNNNIRSHYIEYLQKQNNVMLYDKICPICLDDIEDNKDNKEYVILSCGHCYCFKCLLYLSNYVQTCCICKSIIA